jgi:hypothetical protein
MINFASCFTIGKAHGWGTFPKCRSGLGYHLILGPLFWECPHPRSFTLHLSPVGQALNSRLLQPHNKQNISEMYINPCHVVPLCRLEQDHTEMWVHLEKQALIPRKSYSWRCTYLRNHKIFSKNLPQANKITGLALQLTLFSGGTPEGSKRNLNFQSATLHHFFLYWSLHSMWLCVE